MPTDARGKENMEITDLSQSELETLHLKVVPVPCPACCMAFMEDTNWLDCPTCNNLRMVIIIPFRNSERVIDRLETIDAHSPTD